MLISSNRHNKMESSLGSISISSRIDLKSNCKENTNTSTNQTLKGHDYESAITHLDEDSIQAPEKSRKIQTKITLIQQSQAELQSKFQKVIESLTKEVAKKDELNAMLQAQISSLKAELQQSKKDLGIIVNYLAKRKAKASEGENRRALLNSTKTSGKLEKSLSGSKGSIDFIPKQLKEQRKNKSPRLLIFEKSFKG